MGLELGDKQELVVFWVVVGLAEEVLAAAVVLFKVMAGQHDLS